MSYGRQGQNMYFIIFSFALWCSPFVNLFFSNMDSLERQIRSLRNYREEQSQCAQRRETASPLSTKSICRSASS